MLLPILAETDAVERVVAHGAATLKNLLGIGLEESGHCLSDLFWEQVQAQPEGTAVVHEEERLTYRELAEHSSKLALYLRHLGVEPDACVGLFVEPSIDLHGRRLGDPALRRRLSAALPGVPRGAAALHDRAQSRTKVIFCQERLEARLEALAPQGTRIVTLQDAAGFSSADAATAKRELGIGPRPDNLAYIIYTSGSTGKPKGVMIEHRSIVNQMHWLRTVHGLNQEKIDPAEDPHEL